MARTSASLSVLLLAPLTSGADLEARWLPQDTAWVMHLDLEALQRTETFRQVRGAAEAKGEWEPEEWFEGELAELGVDPLRDVKSLTLYGPGKEREDAVLIARTTDKIHAVTERIRQEEGWRQVQHEGFTFDAMGEEGEAGYFWVHHPEDEGDHLVFATGDPRLLASAVRTFQGLEPAVPARTGEPLELDPRPGSFLFLSAAIGLDGVEGFEAMSEIAGLVSGLVIAAGESEGAFFLDLRVQTASSEDASNLRSVVDGLRALVALGGDEVPHEARRMLDAVRLEVRGTSVRLGFSMPVRELTSSLEALDKEY